MKIGVLMFPTEYSIGPVDLGREVEAHGLESLWFPEHTHIRPAASQRFRGALSCHWNTLIY